MTNETNAVIDRTTIDSVLRELLFHHLDSFFNNDVDALLSDYTNESVVITLEQTFIGLKEIGTFINEIIAFITNGKTILVLDKISVENELGYLVWHTKTPKMEISLGSGTFIIKEGKIAQQTFVGQLKEKIN